jgi:hypothetical protein
MYLVGYAVFRWVMGIRPVIVRTLGAALVLPLGVVGPLWGGDVFLDAATLPVIVLLVIEQGLERKKLSGS